jgi:hypothetical protein
VQVSKSTAASLPDIGPLGRPSHSPPGDGAVGSPEHLHVTFERAVAATDRAVGLWLSRTSGRAADDPRVVASGETSSDVRSLRALVRASATAYARRLRNAGVPPERMVVLVKEAACQSNAIGAAVQELTSDMVRWSIEAYFAE